MTDDPNSFDIKFLSVLAGDIISPEPVWGAWMTACGEWAKGHGYAAGCYQLTDKGLELLKSLEEERT